MVAASAVQRDALIHVTILSFRPLKPAEQISQASGPVKGSEKKADEAIKLSDRKNIYVGSLKQQGLRGRLAVCRTVHCEQSGNGGNC